MTNQQILEKSIQKAISGGWKPGWLDRRPVVKWGAVYSTDFDEGEGVQVIGYHAKSNASYWFFPVRELLFNHDFAKALWGKEVISDTCRCGYKPITEAHSILNGPHGPINDKIGWKKHLQRMVIAEDPIKYLGENI